MIFMGLMFPPILGSLVVLVFQVLDNWFFRAASLGVIIFALWPLAALLKHWLPVEIDDSGRITRSFAAWRKSTELGTPLVYEIKSMQVAVAGYVIPQYELSAKGPLSREILSIGPHAHIEQLRSELERRMWAMDAS
jgi:hypothetical protein